MLDHVFWWVGAILCYLGAIATVFGVIGFIVDYIWKKWTNLDAFVRVVNEANRQGVKLLRKEPQ